MFVKTITRDTSRLFMSTGRRFQSTSSGYASVKKLTAMSELHSAIKSPKLSIIDFYATWCGPCKAMIPTVSKSIAENPEVTFYKVDVDESPDLAKFCEVTAMPTFVFAKAGDMLKKVVGANPHGLQEGIDSLK
ncbi:Trx3p KNAG_0I02730 [Huiozyma naganishii CBS 8797]|uniref:Thioredoxin domain-containing protein n=1 Tax=Huiozyma naganishii (strain ATCC MYA-139 / BCRC 22969 / CBS 8797 / KCTC 17520 / NBRC 10181 / NCYC 3082 / Yp74L-3) TaxID=1071383 RepID=J7RQJ8_HUIN7|nr:hypothetical protein KNAG_0I02730 [Kazachstania naganishii CBS 8797]CCK72058.1 hypothetical protein KNAG_0I02730 [Kazachstania naganishii CBS 8797]